MYKKILLITLLFLFSGAVAIAQNAMVKGQISDAATKETLIGVNIMAKNVKLGSTTNENGDYELKLPAGEHELSFSYVGYSTISRTIQLKENEILVLNLQMGDNKTQLDEIVISGSQYEKRIAEETVSIDIIKDYIIENNNSQDLAEAIETTSGVSIVDGQATIRGGSGYAYGTGSRVQVLVDDMPLLTGDLAEVRWEFVPMEHAEQIEIIKGASSVLYGSSALNGVVSVQTGFAKSKPETKLTLFNGVFLNPRNKLYKWWNGRSHPMFSGMFFSNRQKLGNFDLVLGGNYKLEKSFLYDGDNKHYRFNFKTRYINPKNDRLKVGINANALYQHWGRFFLFNDAYEGAYKGAISDDRYSLMNIDPYVTFTSLNGLRHKFKTRYYNVTRYRQSGFRTHNSNLVFSEYQLQKRFDQGTAVTVGAVGSYTWGFNFLYNNGEPVSSYAGGAYMQVEQKLDRLSLVGGLRYEVNATDLFLLDSLNLDNNYNPLVTRLGLNYKASPTTFIRASFGQGYRSPSIVERFVNEELDFDALPLKLFPNPELVPEKGWNAELAFKQAIRAGEGLNGYLDVALFWTEINNMTEFILVNQGGTIGFQTQNVDRARIAGWEISGANESKINDFTARIYGGYTFNYPANLSVDTTVNVYMNNLFTSISSVDSVKASILKYRFRNVAKLDVQLEYKKLSIGYNLAYNSRMDNIDEIFLVLPFFGIKEYREENPGGTAISNARIVYKAAQNQSVAIIGKNIFNKDHMLRPGMMGPPANITLQYKINL